MKKTDDRKDAAKLFYEQSEFGKSMGRPYREIFERFGLRAAADELGSIGRLPEGNTAYTRRQS